MQDYLETAPCGYFTFNEEGKITSGNARICYLLGYNISALKEKNIEQLLTPASSILYHTHLFPLLKIQGHLDEILITLKGFDGRHVPILFNAKKYSSSGSVNYCCAFITVYHRKKFEDELFAAKKQAEMALLESTEYKRLSQELQNHTELLDEQLVLVEKKNEELRQFNRVVTHELQEPLRKIFVFSERVREDLHANDGGQLKESVARLSQAANNMQKVVSGLQQFVWLQEASLKIEKVDLAVLIGDIIRLESEPENIEYRCDGLIPVMADASQLVILFEELISNAAKFRKPGSRIYLNITGTIIEKNKFRMLSDKYKYESFLKIDVRDEGIGFNPAYTDKAFDLFTRLHNREGRGVGLALCQQIAQNHKGTMSIETAVNEGTTVTILLPI